MLSISGAWKCMLTGWGAQESLLAMSQGGIAVYCLLWSIQATKFDTQRVSTYFLYKNMFYKVLCFLHHKAASISFISWKDNAEKKDQLKPHYTGVGIRDALLNLSHPFGSLQVQHLGICKWWSLFSTIPNALKYTHTLHDTDVCNPTCC